MQLSKQGRELLKKVEGCSLVPYDDQKGLSSAPIQYWVKGATIGVGHLINQAEWPKYKNGITQAEADSLFEKDLKPFEDAVNSAIKVKICQHHFDALVILCFNIGQANFKTSSVVKMVNGESSSYRSLKEAWLAWNKSQGKVMQGLINRRNAEWQIYTQGEYKTW